MTTKIDDSALLSRRSFVASTGVAMAGGVALGTGLGAAAVQAAPTEAGAPTAAAAIKNDSKAGSHSKSAYTLDAIIKVDESLCIKCDACVRCCPGALIAKGKFPTPTADSWTFCIDCGHCVAICPTGALQQRAMGPADCEPIDIHLVPKFDEIRQFLIARRSIRGYVNKPIEKEKILQLLDVARYAPSGGNRQLLRWLVINDPAKVHQVAALTIDWMKSTKDTNPGLYHEAKLEVFIKNWEAGSDHISRGAPCIIQAWAGKDERTAPPAAAIAIAHIQLAATTLGLGSSWTEGIGYASRAYPPLLKVLGMPEGQIPYATFLIGYPTEFYHRIPTRKATDVTWV
jgi:nitroreductase/Pyruvate/2-oxoacid:ferredoxin oxidoreductase delta subunit